MRMFGVLIISVLLRAHGDAAGNGIFVRFPLSVFNTFKVTTAFQSNRVKILRLHTD